MKFVLSLCLMACLATVAWTSSASWGRRLPNDFVLHRENVFRRAQKGGFQTGSVVFPYPGQYNNRNITLITVNDNFRNNSGANPTLWSGGPNFKFAQVYLKSLYSGGINSTVSIYGR